MVSAIKKGVFLHVMRKSGQQQARLSVASFRCLHSYRCIGPATYEKLCPGKAGKVVVRFLFFFNFS